MKPVVFFFSAAHFGEKNRRLWPSHGPQTWPWWKLFQLCFCDLNPHIPFSSKQGQSWRMWVYTRVGAVFFDVAVRRIMR